MTPEQASQIQDLIERVDEQVSSQRTKDLEAHFDASDRQVFQLAQLKSLNMSEQTTELLARLIAANMEEADPTS